MPPARAALPPAPLPFPGRPLTLFALPLSKLFIMHDMHCPDVNFLSYQNTSHFFAVLTENMLSRGCAIPESPGCRDCSCHVSCVQAAVGARFCYGSIRLHGADMEAVQSYPWGDL